MLRRGDRSALNNPNDGADAIDSSSAFTVSEKKGKAKII